MITTLDKTFLEERKVSDKVYGKHQCQRHRVAKKKRQIVVTSNIYICTIFIVSIIDLGWIDPMEKLLTFSDHTVLTRKKTIKD